MMVLQRVLGDLRGEPAACPAELEGSFKDELVLLLLKLVNPTWDTPKAKVALVACHAIEQELSFADFAVSEEMMADVLTPQEAQDMRAFYKDVSQAKATKDLARCTMAEDVERHFPLKPAAKAKAKAAPGPAPRWTAPMSKNMDAATKWIERHKPMLGSVMAVPETGRFQVVYMEHMKSVSWTARGQQFGNGFLLTACCWSCFCPFPSKC
jgi:hypothetical protein